MIFVRRMGISMKLFFSWNTWTFQYESGSLTDNHWSNNAFMQCWHKSSFKQFPSPKIEPKPARRSIDRNSLNSGLSFSAKKWHLSQIFAEMMMVSFGMKNCISPLWILNKDYKSMRYIIYGFKSHWYMRWFRFFNRFCL